LEKAFAGASGLSLPAQPERRYPRPKRPAVSVVHESVPYVGTIPAQREPNRRNFRFGHRSVDELQRVGLAGNRSRVKGGPVGIMPEARPSPVLRARRARLATGSAARSRRQSRSREKRVVRDGGTILPTLFKLPKELAVSPYLRLIFARRRFTYISVCYRTRRLLRKN